MQFSLLALATVLGLSVAAPAKPAFVHVPLTRGPPAGSNSLNNPSKDASNGNNNGEYNLQLLNEYLSYSASFQIGGQSISANMDTGSQILWVWSQDSEFCQSQAGSLSCALSGSYNASLSKTSRDTGETFDLQYGVGSASGDYYNDTLDFGGAPLTNFTFGVNAGAYANNSSPVFGIGPNSDNDTSLSAQLVKQGYTKRNVYGLSLGPAGDSQIAELTFGAVNTGRFDGKLKTLKIDNDPYHFRLKASGTINGKSFLDNGDVILDSGTSLSYLNPDTWSKFDEVVQNSGLTLGQTSGFTTFPCADGDKLELELDFDGQVIKASGKDLGVPLYLISPRTKDTTSCILGVLPGGPNLDGFNLFGDTFLRNVYAVYDLDHNEVSLAQAVYNKPNNYVVIDGAVPDSE